MKRGGNLRRSKPLRARKSMRKVSVKQAAKRAAAGERCFGSTIRPAKPAKAKAGTYIGPDKATAAAVVDREQSACLVCGRYLEPGRRGSLWSIHHRRRPRTDNRMSNLIAVCGGADVPGCHQAIHADVAASQKNGLLVKRTGDTVAQRIATQSGWVHLHDDGGLAQASEQEVSA